MKSNLAGWAGLVALGALLLPTAPGAQQHRSAMAPAQSMARDKSDGEEWQIEQRRRWWIESRGLKQNGNAAKQRRAALTLLRDQLIRQKRTGRSVGGRAQTAPWRELGPSSMRMDNWMMGRVAGRINAVTPHPANDGIVFIGAANGGVWKTTDAGASWTPTFVNVGSQSISAIHVEAGNPQNVWAGTGDRFDGDCSGYLSDGVFFSTDGGLNWSARNSGMNLSTITSLVTQANNANVVLAAGFGDRCNQGGDADGGIYRSTDKGATWTEVMSRRVEDLVAIPGTSTVYASAPGSGVYRSTDGGATWTLLGVANTSSRMRLAVAPSNASVIYALTSSTLHRSDDAGSTWSSVNTAACDGQCGYNLALSVHPTDPATVTVGAIRPYRSSNGGTTLVPLTATWGWKQTVHQDIHVVRYSLNDANRLWIAGDGGIWRTDNAASTWVNMNANLNITQFYDIAVHPTDPNIVFGGAQDNSSSVRSGSSVWDLTFVSGDGFMNAVDETDAAVIFQNSYPWSDQNRNVYPAVYRSMRFGAPGTFAFAGNSGLEPGGYQWVTAADLAGGFHFVGGNYVSRAAKDSPNMQWTTISPRVDGVVNVIAARKIGDAVHVYAGTSTGKIYYSANAASVNLSDAFGNLPAQRVSDIAIDPANGSRAFLTLSSFGGSKLYRTVNGGSSWVALGTGLPNIPANTVAIDPRNTQRIFVGTDIGVYESVDDGASFVPFSDGMPAGLVISDLEIDDAPYVLTAATYGRGAWQTTLGDGIDNRQPNADFAFSARGLTVSFTDASSDSDGSIVRRTWHFGDGTTTTSTNPLHTYSTAGTYRVTLTVVDNLGYSHTRSLRLPMPLSRRARNDFNGDGRSDIGLWNASLSYVGYWLMDGASFAGSSGFYLASGYAPASTGFLSPIPQASLLARNTGTQMLSSYIWDGTTHAQGIIGGAPAGWDAIGQGDINGDGKDDLLWRNPGTGQFAYWLMDGAVYLGGNTYSPPATYVVAGIADFNGDGLVDLLWNDPGTRNASVWMSNGNGFSVGQIGQYGTTWNMVGTADVTGDGKADILLRDNDKVYLAYWRMDGAVYQDAAAYGLASDRELLTTGDFDGDADADLVITQPSQRTLALWRSNRTAFTEANIGQYGDGWSVLR